MRTLISVLSLAVCTSLVAPAFADKVKEPATGVELDAQKTDGGKTYTLVGLGVRKKFGFKVYAMGLYVENVDGKRAFPSLATKAGGTDKAKLTSGDRAQSFIVWGGFGKLAIMHFVRDVGADKVREAFESGLSEELSDKASPDLREATQNFLKLVDRDLKSGDEIEIKTNNEGRLELSIGGQAKGGVTNAKLARAIWNVWLGSKPVTADLKADLVNRIDELGK
jgi:hypothetical protein